MYQALAITVALMALLSSMCWDAVNTSKRWTRQAEAAVLAGNTADAEKFFLKAIHEAERSSNRSAHAATLEHVAAFYKDNQQIERAIQLYTIAMEIRQHTTGEDAPELVADLRTTAELWQSTGDVTHWQELMQQAIDICARHADTRLSR